MSDETRCHVCNKTQDELRAGRKFSFNGYHWFCDECHGGRVQPGAIYPFTTTHLDGTPITVNSTYHLRKLEAQHGVQHAAMNMDARNLDHYEHRR